MVVTLKLQVLHTLRRLIVMNPSAMCLRLSLACSFVLHVGQCDTDIVMPPPP